jgi:NADP-dependent 3-hydroxy acid dehydrogenase YdfG
MYIHLDRRFDMNGNIRFEDKVVAITGASSGIGRATA